METDPDNYVALNNIGGTFLQLGKLNLAERYLSKAYKANPTFPHITLGLGLVSFEKGELPTAFDYAIETFKNEEHVDGAVFQKALQLALESARSLGKQQVGKETLVDYKLLAYYYVSWALAIPEMLKELQMPFEREYELAITLSGKASE
nr:hypothetical protein [Lunatimonas lonarensis]